MEEVEKYAVSVSSLAFIFMGLPSERNTNSLEKTEFTPSVKISLFPGPLAI
jgi:hypothetical protein